MRNVITSLLTAICVLGFVSVANAQKIGHFDYTSVLSEMPEVKAADAQIATYRDQLIADGEKKAAAWQVKVQQFQNEYNQGTLTPVQAKQKEEA